MLQKAKSTISGNKLIAWIKKSWLSIIVVALLANIALVSGTGAMEAPTGVPYTFESVGESVRTIFNVVILVAGIIFVILFLVGGIQYLTASGNEESSGKARKLLLDAIVGLVIVLAAWAIGGWIIKQLTGEELGGGGEFE